MRVFLVVLLSFGILGAAKAETEPTPCDSPEGKSRAHVLSRMAFDREGGETIADAVPIASLPYDDTGATCDNADDYDAVCPYDTPGSPDVVYSYEVATEIALTVDLCGSAYDTKVYVLDADLEVLLCNDDFYFDDECGEYVSRIDGGQIDGGQTVYIVVDGYGGDCGAYVLHVDAEPYDPCILVCPPDAVLEGEPPLEDGYFDEYNGGCCGNPYDDPMQDLWGQGDNSLVFCAVSGWYQGNGMQYRDTDHFIAVFGETGVIEVAGDAELELYVFELWPPDCAEVGVAQNIIVGPCEENTLVVTGEPGSLTWLWAGPTNFVPPLGYEGNEYDYILRLSGLADGVVATETSSWSGVKALYR